MQVTIRWASPAHSHQATERAAGVVLLTPEANTIRLVIGGFYFDTARGAEEILAAFKEEGFEREDFGSIGFSW